VQGTNVEHPIFARVYTWAAAYEPGPVRAHRRELIAGLAGRVVEVGVGPGQTFAHYPPAVTELVAVEPEPAMRRAAERAARDAPIPVRVVDATADALPLGDGEVDAAVASLVLCSVPDQAAALAELHRVLVPGGELRVYEHVRAQRPWLAAVQRTVDRLGWPRMAGGCHTHRDTPAAVAAAGFEVERLRRTAIAGCLPVLPIVPHALVHARRPASAFTSRSQV
jgi:SAM-dependent methyltransferase